MSIIYDALKKTQRKRQTIHESTINMSPKMNRTLPKVRSKSYILPSMLFIGLLITFTGYQYTQYQAAYKAPAAVKKAVDLTLNGVFVSDKSKIAMINNDTYKVGDRINGMQIVAIDMNLVTMKDKDQNTVTLKSIV